MMRNIIDFKKILDWESDWTANQDNYDNHIYIGRKLAVYNYMVIIIIYYLILVSV